MRSVSERAAQPAGAGERILSAALDLFSAHGVDGVSVRAIAAAADVSPALVMHHFGSKVGLRAACDERTLLVAREALGSLLALMVAADGAADGEGPPDPPTVPADLLSAPTRTALAYLARGVVEGGAAGDALVDEVVGMTRASLSAPATVGAGRSIDDLDMTAVLLTLYDLAPLVMSRHVRRLTGSDPYQPDGFARQARAALALFHPLATARREPDST
jgi:AcrR family transcriptional regulator